MYVQNHNGGGRQPVNQPAVVVVVDSTTAMVATLLLIMKCPRCLAVKLASLKCPKKCATSVKLIQLLLLRDSLLVVQEHECGTHSALYTCEVG